MRNNKEAKNLKILNISVESVVIANIPKSEKVLLLVISHFYDSNILCGMEICLDKGYRPSSSNIKNPRAISH